MSPNAYLAFNDAGLLCGYQGEAEHEEPVFTWTYAEFEEYIDEAITPSMYNYMSSYVDQQMTKEELYEIQGGDYCTGALEAEAVDAYFDLPLIDRIRMHEQELVNLRASKRTAEAKESAAIDAMLDEDKPFDETSPIAHEYAEFMRGLIAKNRAAIDRLERELHEEEQWRGGHEGGASDLETDENYDPMET
jgi:3'-phosphoadenosine 5'-phosphosulfate sulfotransferase (PAPS reductase)/FAD synthetase